MSKEHRWLRRTLLSVLSLVALALFAAPVAAQGGEGTMNCEGKEEGDINCTDTTDAGAGLPEFDPCVDAPWLCSGTPPPETTNPPPGPGCLTCHDDPPHDWGHLGEDDEPGAPMNPETREEQCEVAYEQLRIAEEYEEAKCGRWWQFWKKVSPSCMNARNNVSYAQGIADRYCGYG